MEENDVDGQIRPNKAEPHSRWSNGNNILCVCFYVVTCAAKTALADLAYDFAASFWTEYILTQLEEEIIFFETRISWNAATLNQNHSFKPVLKLCFDHMVSFAS